MAYGGPYHWDVEVFLVEGLAGRHPEWADFGTGVWRVGERNEWDDFLNLGAAGLTDLVAVGHQYHDGFGSGGRPVGGVVIVYAFNGPVDDVLARLSEVHGPPEIAVEGPEWAQGPYWTRMWDSDRGWHGAGIRVLADPTARPPGIDLSRVPDSAAGLLWCDHTYGFREPDGEGKAPEPERPRRRWFRRRG